MAKKKPPINLAMARQGTQYSDPDGAFSLSWPWNGKREIVAMPADMVTKELQRHIIEGSVVELDEEPNTEVAPTRAVVSTVLTGAEARARLEEPPPEEGVQFGSYRSLGGTSEVQTFESPAEASPESETPPEPPSAAPEPAPEPEAAPSTDAATTVESAKVEKIPDLAPKAATKTKEG